ncbi:MAG: CADD family putative folate metabolism protein [Terriglobales bacterium]
MTFPQFCEQLEERISKYDLLCHPFYKAWAAGELTREELRAYAADYYPHVAAFPEYLRAAAARTVDGGLRAALLLNRADEMGADYPGARPHEELWLDFAEGMGAQREEVRRHTPIPEVEELMASFRRVAEEGSSAEALAAFYAYESQVPRVAKEKARGLRELYGADARSYGYFTLHQTADVHHAQVWKQQLERELAADPEAAAAALEAAEAAARALWRALDGIEERRQAHALHAQVW